MATPAHKHIPSRPVLPKRAKGAAAVLGLAGVKQPPPKRPPLASRPAASAAQAAAPPPADAAPAAAADGRAPPPPARTPKVIPPPPDSKRPKAPPPAPAQPAAAAAAAGAAPAPAPAADGASSQWSWAAMLASAQQHHTADTLPDPEGSGLPPDPAPLRIDFARVRHPDFAGRVRPASMQLLERRQRPGVQQPSAGRFWRGELRPDADEAAALQLWEAARDKLARRRADYVSQKAEHALGVHPYPGHEPLQMNMGADVARACLDVIECYDLTYACFTSVNDVIESAAELSSVGAVGGDDRVSHCFCLVYLLFLLRVSKKQLRRMQEHGSCYVRAVAAIYLRFVAPPRTLCTLLRQGVAVADRSVCMAEAAGEFEREDAPFNEFIIRLLGEGPDCLDAGFPAFNKQEEDYVSRSIHRWVMEIEAKRKAEASRDVDAQLREQLDSEEERERHEQIRRRFTFGTMLYGFDNLQTQLGWVTYSVGPEEERIALQRQLELQREEEKLEAHRRAAEEARAAEERARTAKQFIDGVDVSAEAPLRQQQVKRNTAARKKQQLARKRARRAEQAADSAESDSDAPGGADPAAAAAPPEPAKRARKGAGQADGEAPYLTF
eukprot:TRINITY_DN6758_c0_g1_i1.p2 TRINITY_DN6758_c0_g1~~TRINITY_DN6758_c0_g1_i1.p2  ORF type:complete len:634 (+),score=221.41 TRINITY_DN6758_c0_g1_i1:75-1904(+)